MTSSARLDHATDPVIPRRAALPPEARPGIDGPHPARPRPAPAARPPFGSTAIGASGFLALQRLAGNRALSGLMGGPATAAPAGAAPAPPDVASPEGAPSDVVADDRLEAEAQAAGRPGRGEVGALTPPPPPRTPASPPSASRAGRALRPEVRSAVDRHFGWDFSNIRIHQDDGSAARVRAAGAHALTVGDDISVGGPAGDIEAEGNRALLHHELAHSVQQSPDRGRARAGGLAAGLSAAAPAPHPAPTVTAVNAAAEMGAGRTLNVTATAAGKGALTWTLVGAPPGVTIVPRGLRGATIRSAATPLGTTPAGAGTNFQARAALTATPGDSAVSGNILFVAVNAVAVTPNPAQIAVPMAGGGTQAAPANVLDPNRDGMTGNTGNVTAPATTPGGRPVTVALPQAAGATSAGLVITPGATTGRIRVRVTDDATKTSNELANPTRIDAMPTKVTGFGAPAAPPAGVYGSINPIRFGQTDNAAPSTRVIGETITAGGSDAFGLTAGINAPTGPNPAPTPGLSAPANGWNDQLFTPQAAVDVNRFVGKNAPGGALPAVWQLRQGFHAFGWNGVRSPVEFDNGSHIRSLIQVGANFFFRTEHRFPGGSVVAPLNPYAAVNPLIRLTGIAGAANAPAAVGGIAADGVATGNATVATTVPGRNAIWSVVSGPIAIAGAPTPVGTPAVVQAGLVPGRFPVKVVDQAFPNREGTGTISIVPVRLSGLVAAPSPVPAGTLSANLTLNAAPGGRTVTWTVDAAAAAAGVTVVGVAAAPAVATTAVLTRPVGFTGTVTVTATDSVLANKSTSVRVRFQ